MMSEHWSRTIGEVIAEEWLLKDAGTPGRLTATRRPLRVEIRDHFSHHPTMNGYYGLPAMATMVGDVKKYSQNGTFTNVSVNFLETTYYSPLGDRSDRIIITAISDQGMSHSGTRSGITADVRQCFRWLWRAKGVGHD